MKVTSDGNGLAKEVNPYLHPINDYPAYDNPQWYKFEETNHLYALLNEDETPLRKEGVFNAVLEPIGCRRKKEFDYERSHCICGYMNFEANFCMYRDMAYIVVPLTPRTEASEILRKHLDVSEIVFEDLIHKSPYNECLNATVEHTKNKDDTIKELKDKIDLQQSVLDEIMDISFRASVMSISTHYVIAIGKIQDALKRIKS